MWGLKESFSMEGEYNKLRPVILTCDHPVRRKAQRKFVESYKTVASHLLSPIILAGYSQITRDTEYDDLLAQLEPHQIVPQTNYAVERKLDYKLTKKMPQKWRSAVYLNIQKVVIRDFPSVALKFSQPGENILWLEDDIIFSSQFPRIIPHVSKLFEEDFCDFITLHTNTIWNLDWMDRQGRFPRPRKKKMPKHNLMYPFDGRKFFCTQAVAFRRPLIESFYSQADLVDEATDINAWDIKWGHFLEKNDYRMYATYHSFVQHQACKSILNKTRKLRTSSKFFIP